MASGAIKGITISFAGDTTKLDKALRQINNETKSIDKELRQVDKALKFNPTSLELWQQKQDLLTRKVAETKTKLDTLKQAQAKMDAEGVDKNSDEYKRLQREIIVTQNQVKNFEGQLRKVGNVKLRATSEQFKEVGNKLTAAGEAMKGVSMAAGAVVGSLGLISYKAGKAADDLNTLSKVTGIGTQNLQKYSYAADLVDVSTESIAKANKKLGQNAYNAANGSKAQAEAFEKLGVSVTDADGNLRDSEDIFQDTITALGKMDNETERNALAQKLMGKSASELNPLIEDGGETYKMVADTLKKYDLDFVDQETLDKANEFNDELDTMKLIGSVALAQVGSQLAATLAPALEKVVGWIGKLANWLTSLDPKVLTIIGTVAGIIAVLAPVLLFLGKMSFAISSIISLVGTIGPALAGVMATLGPVILIIGALVAAGILLYKNWDKIKAKATEIWEHVKTTFETLKKDVITIWNGIKAFFIKVVNAIIVPIVTKFNNLKTKIATIWTNIKTKITTTWTNIKTGVTDAVNAVRDKISKTFGAVKDKVSDVWGKIKKAIVDPIEKAKEKVDAAVNAIKDFFPLKLGKILNFSLPTISIGTKEKTIAGKTIKVPDFSINWASHALGGIITKRMLMQSGDTIHEFGEAGPEAIIPLNKFWDKLDQMSTGETTINIVINGAGDPRAVADEVKRMLIRETNQRRLAWQ